MNREGHSDRSERVTVPGGQFLSELAKWFAPEAAEELRAAGYNVDDIPREAAEVRFVSQDEAGNVVDISQAAEVCKLKDGQAFWRRAASRTGAPITACDNPELILEHAIARAEGVRDLARIDERARAQERHRIKAESKAPKKLKQNKASKRNRKTKETPLTKRQSEVFTAYVNNGYCEAKTARQLGVARSTIQGHLRSAFSKIPALAASKLTHGRGAPLPEDGRGQVNLSDSR